MKHKKEEVTVSGEVLDTEQRHVVRVGGSNHISLPRNRPNPSWKSFFTKTVLNLKLVRDEDGDLCILITMPEKQKFERRE